MSNMWLGTQRNRSEITITILVCIQRSGINKLGVHSWELWVALWNNLVWTVFCALGLKDVELSLDVHSWMFHEDFGHFYWCLYSVLLCMCCVALPCSLNTYECSCEHLDSWAGVSVPLCSYFMHSSKLLSTFWWPVVGSTWDWNV